MTRHRGIAFVTFLILVISDISFAARKDFKGLFGSFRREKFSENEAHSTDFGVDLLLSTMLPMSALATSTERTTDAYSPLATSTFFNVEGNFFVTFNYNWQIFANVGWYNYDTRKQNTIYTENSQPTYQQFEMEAVPLLLGVKYRFSTDDIVPYVGFAAGISHVRRKAFYDYSSISLQDINDVASAQAIFGVEFYFSSQAGIRLETSAFYMKLPTNTLNQGSLPTNPIINMEANPIMIRYASGVFFLF